MADIGMLVSQVKAMSDELDKRYNQACLLDEYYDGSPRVPLFVQASKQTKAYMRLLKLADTNWPQLIVDSVEERLEVQALQMGQDETLTDRAWEIWQANDLDADASLVHQSALTTARAYAIVWPANGSGDPVVTIEHTSSCIVQYAQGSRSIRVAALRRWRDDKNWYATLYLPDGLYKFISKNTVTETPGSGEAGSPSNANWVRRDVPNETWPLQNPLAPEVPVVEFSVNRRLRTGVYGCAMGEFEPNLGHIDRINYALFSQLVAMTWSGFPLRAVIGDPIVRDDDDNPIKPFDVVADSIVQMENPEAQLFQLPEASLENYGKAIDRYVEQLAALTKTPAHYLLGQLVNVSADAIRAAEAGLVSKIRRHHRSLGEGWEEVARLALIADGQTLDASTQSAEIMWKDPESRSMAERADAASKLVNILPWQVLCSKVLGMSPQEIDQAEIDRASDQLLAPMPPAPVPPMNGVPMPAV